MLKILIGLLVVAGMTPTASARGQSTALSPITISRNDAGSIKTPLGYDIVVNKGSSLQRQAVTVHDSRLPADIDGNASLKTAYERQSYHFKALFSIKAKEDVVAIEVRFIAFDVFGDRMKVFSTTEVTDIPKGTSASLDPQWSSWENEVSEYFASLAFIARVRTGDGKVVSADLAPVLVEATKFAKKLTLADLEPKAERP